MWKAAQNLLPTAENLWKKRILQQPWCQRCGRQGENVAHALIACKASQKIWKTTTFSTEMQSLANQELLSVLQELAKKRSKSDMEVFIALCWANWHSRNLSIFEGKKEDSQVSVARAEATVVIQENQIPPKTSYLKSRNSSKSDLETSSSRLL